MHRLHLDQGSPNGPQQANLPGLPASILVRPARKCLRSHCRFRRPGTKLRNQPTRNVSTLSNVRALRALGTKIQRVSAQRPSVGKRPRRRPQLQPPWPPAGRSGVQISVRFVGSWANIERLSDGRVAVRFVGRSPARRRPGDGHFYVQVIGSFGAGRRPTRRPLFWARRGSRGGIGCLLFPALPCRSPTRRISITCWLEPRLAHARRHGIPCPHPTTPRPAQPRTRFAWHKARATSAG